MSGRPRSDAALAYNKRAAEARAALEAQGLKKNSASVKRYLNGQLASGATAAPAAPSANITVKRPRTAKEAAANQRRRNAIAALKAQGLKQNSASVKRYLNGQLASGAAAAAVVKNEVILEEEELENNNGVLPSLVTAQVLAPAKGTLSHAEAGKKAAKSAKGSAWLDQIAAAKSNLNTSFAEVGLNKKATRANAMRLASTRRNNPGQARNIELNILSHAQGKAFNKNKKPNKTARKSTKKRNNSLNRATRNIANRMRNRLTRKPARNYGTIKQTKRNNNNSYRPFKDNNNNIFNIEELRNAPFNSAQ